MENTLKGKYFIDDCMAYCLAHIVIVFCFLLWCKNCGKTFTVVENEKKRKFKIKILLMMRTKRGEKNCLQKIFELDEF